MDWLVYIFAKELGDEREGKREENEGRREGRVRKEERRKMVGGRRN